jgi:hypothetical protein
LPGDHDGAQQGDLQSWVRDCPLAAFFGHAARRALSASLAFERTKWALA